MHIQTFSWAAALALIGCSPSPSAPSPDSPAGGPPDAVVSERPKLTQAQCEAQGGTVTGDIGDGATSRPDYVCASGKKPSGNIVPAEGGPIAVEGAVCCPR
ncbi:MAG TPA: hypothetical protein VFS43_42405 [Polyangiaceae bacterium]|nr:hypothetical protein [Polyangiaceae bacterium]